MSEATELALRALSHRDRSRRELEWRLDQAGIPADQREQVLDELESSGVLSDERFAEARARGLLGRNASDALIRNDLRSHGIAADTVATILEAFEPEAQRAGRIFERRGGGERALRYLAGKGFQRESLAGLLEADPLH